MLLALQQGHRRVPLAILIALLQEDGDPWRGMPRVRMSIDAIASEDDAYHDFRFTRVALFRLVPLLHLPESFCTHRNRYTADREEAVLLVLYRLAYPGRWRDRGMRETFQRSASELSEIFNETVGMLHRQWTRLITCWRDVFAPPNARFLAEATARKMGYNGALFLLFGDGSDIYITRPGGSYDLQRAMYTGHHRQHAVLFLGFVTPNGMWAMVFGPFAGTTNDVTAYTTANVESKLRHLLAPVNAGRAPGDVVSAAGDSIFPQSDVMQVRRTGVLTRNERDYNIAFSSVRIAVEWSFSKVFTLWAHTNWYMKLSVGASPVGTVVLVAFFLTNCHTCFYGSQVGQYFGVLPPTIEEYLH